MDGEISLPMWIFMILLLGAAITFFQYIVYPMIAAYVNARSRMVLEEITPGLQLKLSPFTLTRRHVLADRLSSDDVVEAALEGFAQKKGLSKEQIRRETWRLAWDIVPAFNPYFYFRLGFRMARACLRALYRLKVTFSDGGRLAEVASDDAVIFIINHRSNIDYAVANYLTARRTMLSFGVGEWSRIWPIQPFMRMAGGYFVRRNSDDPHYRLLLKRYVQLATHARVPHAIFIEGKLSNDGGLGPPRMGLVSYVTEEFDPARSPDIVFIPIGMNYDWVIEDVNVTRYRSEQFQAMGRGYVIRETLHFLAMMVWELLRPGRRFGVQCSNFGAPVSLSKWLADRGVDWSSLDRGGRFAQINALGERLMADLSGLIPATPMSVLCLIWHEDPAYLGNRDEALDRFRMNVDRLRAAGCHVALIERSGGDGLRVSFWHALGIALERRLLTEDRERRLSMVAANAALLDYYGHSIRQHLGERQPGQTRPMQSSSPGFQASSPAAS